MPDYGMGFKSYLTKLDDESLSKTRRKMNKKSHKGRHYGVDPRDIGSSGLSSPTGGNGSSNSGNGGANGGVAESGALPFSFGPDVTASSVYGQGMGYEQQEDDEERDTEDFDLEREPEEDDDAFDLEDDEEEFDLEREDEDEGDPDKQGIIRTVSNAHLVFKRQNEVGTYDELWIYNTGPDLKDELEIRREILAGTDIPPNRTESEDGTQKYYLTTMGNAQYLHITGIPN